MLKRLPRNTVTAFTYEDGYTVYEKEGWSVDVLITLKSGLQAVGHFSYDSKETKVYMYEKGTYAIEDVATWQYLTENESAEGIEIDE